MFSRRRNPPDVAQVDHLSARAVFRRRLDGRAARHRICGGNLRGETLSRAGSHRAPWQDGTRPPFAGEGALARGHRGAARTDERRLHGPRESVRQHHRARRKDALRHDGRRFSRAAHQRRCATWRQRDNFELVSWEHDGQVYHGFATSVPTNAPELPHAVVAVALDFAAHREFMAEFYEILWLAIAAGILSTGLLGWIAARRGLAPLRDMTNVAQSITASRLHDRLPMACLADGARRSGGSVQRHAVPPRRLVSPPVRVFVGSGARAAHAHRQPDDANAGGALADAIGGRIPRGAVLEFGGVRAARPHDRGHAVPGQSRQWADRAAARRRSIWRSRCGSCSSSTMRWRRTRGSAWSSRETEPSKEND